MSTVRPATIDDVPELVRHRELLFTAMGRDMSGPAEWRDATVHTLKEALGGDSMAVFVVDGEVDGQVDGQGNGQGNGRPGLAASGIGVIDRRLPGPETPNGRWGHISGMVTDPRHRRKGHARAIMTELLAWFYAHEVRRIEMNATPDGDALYREFGFTEHHATALTWTAR
jgi:GNAT superfamily N-acetyltransferase